MTLSTWVSFKDNLFYRSCWMTLQHLSVFLKELNRTAIADAVHVPDFWASCALFLRTCAVKFPASWVAYLELATAEGSTLGTQLANLWNVYVNVITDQGVKQDEPSAGLACH